MEYEARKIDWNANAGRRLDALARALPPHPRLDITVFGSVPLQLLVDNSFLSEDIDLSSSEEHWEFLEEFVAEKGWAKGSRIATFKSATRGRFAALSIGGSRHRS